MDEKYVEIPFWGFILKSILKSPTTIRREDEVYILRLLPNIVVFIHSIASFSEFFCYLCCKLLLLTKFRDSMSTGSGL